MRTFYLKHFFRGSLSFFICGNPAFLCWGGTLFLLLLLLIIPYASYQLGNTQLAITCTYGWGSKKKILILLLPIVMCSLGSQVLIWSFTLNMFLESQS